MHNNIFLKQSFYYEAILETTSWVLPFVVFLHVCFSSMPISGDHRTSTYTGQTDRQTDTQTTIRKEYAVFSAISA